MKLNDYLTSRGLTPEAFAELIEIDPVSVRRYVQETRRPKWDVAARIARVTGGEVTANDFLPEAPPEVLKRKTRPSRRAEARSAV